MAAPTGDGHIEDRERAASSLDWKVVRQKRRSDGRARRFADTDAGSRRNQLGIASRETRGGRWPSSTTPRAGQQPGTRAAIAEAAEQRRRCDIRDEERVRQQSSWKSLKASSVLMRGSTAAKMY